MKTVGNTPLVRLNRLTEGINATVLAKNDHDIVHRNSVSTGAKQRFGDGRNFSFALREMIHSMAIGITY